MPMHSTKIAYRTECPEQFVVDISDDPAATFLIATCTWQGGGQAEWPLLSKEPGPDLLVLYLKAVGPSTPVPGTLKISLSSGDVFFLVVPSKLCCCDHCPDDELKKA